MSSKNSTKIGTDNLTADLSTDVDDTRDTLDDAHLLPGSARRGTAWWASIGAGVVAAAAAAVGALKWQQARRRPKARAARAWRGLTERLSR